MNLAVELVKEGKTKQEIVDNINNALEDTKSYLIPHDFDFLVRGGRVSALVGKIGSAIKLVPVMTLSEDKQSLVKFATKRTFKKAIKKIVEEMIECGVDSNYKIYITHACKEDLAEEAKNIILNDIENADIDINLLSPVFTTQGGPGCVAITIYKKT